MTTKNVMTAVYVAVFLYSVVAGITTGNTIEVSIRQTVCCDNKYLKYYR